MRICIGCFALFAAACATIPPPPPPSNTPPQAAAQQSPLGAPMSVSQDAEANTLYARAEEMFAHGDPRTGGAFANAREAIRLYQQAADRDSHLALAYVQIARAWQMQGYSNPDAPPGDVIERSSRAALTRALEIDPNLPQAHQMLAQIYYLSDYNWAAAEREYRWAIEHDSSNAAAHAGLAGFLATMGRFDEAMRQAILAENIRHSAGDAFSRARIYYDMRNYDAAVEHCRRSLSMQENQAVRFFLGLMLIAQGHPQDGLTELENAAHQGDNAGAWLGLAYGYATVGRADEARQIVSTVTRTHAEAPPYRLAAVYLALGDRDEAIRQLRADHEGHGNWTVQLKVDPVMDPLRADPRFQALVRTLNFPV